MSSPAVASEATYTVTGMTCGHCAGAVREEIGALAGVREVAVDLPSGAVTVTSDGPLAVQDVAAAVEEAGYELVRPSDSCCGCGACDEE